MKTIKYILLGAILSSLLFSSFYINPTRTGFLQSEEVTFCETFTQEELISKLDIGDRFFTWVEMENTAPGSSKIGRCSQDNLETLLEYIQSDGFKSKVPEDLIIVQGNQVTDQMINLFAIRKSPLKGEFPSGSDLEQVSISSSEDKETYMLSFSFSESGSKKWASMTRLNVGKDIAILSQGKVLAAPRLTEEITDGKCAISGNYTEDEVNKLKAAFEN